MYVHCWQSVLAGSKAAGGGDRSGGEAASRDQHLHCGSIHEPAAGREKGFLRHLPAVLKPGPNPGLHLCVPRARRHVEPRQLVVQAPITPICGERLDHGVHDLHPCCPAEDKLGKRMESYSKRNQLLMYTFHSGATAGMAGAGRAAWTVAAGAPSVVAGVHAGRCWKELFQAPKEMQAQVETAEAQGRSSTHIHPPAATLQRSPHAAALAHSLHEVPHALALQMSPSGDRFPSIRRRYCIAASQA